MGLGGFFHFNNLIPAGCPEIQCSSDMIYLEKTSDPIDLGFRLTRQSPLTHTHTHPHTHTHTSDASCKSRLSIVLPWVRLIC